MWNKENDMKTKHMTWLMFCVLMFDPFTLTLHWNSDPTEPRQPDVNTAIPPSSSTIVKQWPSVLNNKTHGWRRVHECVYSGLFCVVIPAGVIDGVLWAVMVTVTPQETLRLSRSSTSCHMTLLQLPRIPQQHAVQNISWLTTERRKVSVSLFAQQ